MTNISIKHLGSALTVSALLCACGSSAPSQQLVDARRAYQRAQTSDAARLEPDQLLNARQALNKAEQAHEDDPGSDQEAHLGYLAERRAEIAIARGNIARAARDKKSADETYQSRLKQTASQSQENLAKMNTELQGERLARTNAEQGKAKAESQTAAALASLSQFANVREDSRGTVIVMPGSVLFPSGKDQLSAVAVQSLAQLAEGIKQDNADSAITVEGHTDDRGANSMNDALSTKRAQAVADQLIRGGVEAQRVKVVGRGESTPIADNATSEGRANNRRVEIIIAK